jgi:putative sensory transduction regulator
VSEPRDVLDAYMSSLDAEVRRLAPGERGLTVEAGGSSLHVGVAVRDGFVRAQAWVAAADAIDMHQLLFWNRQTTMVRFAHTRAGDVHVMGEIPEEAVTPEQLDRLLGLLVAAADGARQELS